MQHLCCHAHQICCQMHQVSFYPGQVCCHLAPGAVQGAAAFDPGKLSLLNACTSNCEGAKPLAITVQAVQLLAQVQMQLLLFAALHALLNTICFKQSLDRCIRVQAIMTQILYLCLNLYLHKCVKLCGCRPVLLYLALACGCMYMCWLTLCIHSANHEQATFPHQAVRGSQGCHCAISNKNY